MAPSPLTCPFSSRYSSSKYRIELKALVCLGNASKIRFIFSPWQKSSRESDSIGKRAKAEGIADKGPIVISLISTSQGFQNSHVSDSIRSNKSACTASGIGTVTDRRSNGAAMRAWASSITFQQVSSFNGNESSPLRLFHKRSSFLSSLSTCQPRS